MPATTPDDFKLPPPSRQDMVNWVEETYRLISSDKDMVKRSFDVCGITTSDFFFLTKLKIYSNHQTRIFIHHYKENSCLSVYV